jgi:hypothetical protein
MIRAYAQPERFGDVIALSLVRTPDPGDHDGKPRVLRLGVAENGGFQTVTWEDFEPHASVEPTLRLGMHEALALAEALADLQHGTAEHRALRKDYDAERARVDKLIDTLSTVATESSG